MLETVNTFLAARGIYCLVFILFFLAVYGMITCKNYMKKMMCMNVMQVAVILFFLCFAQKRGGIIPILDGVTEAASGYLNPIPHALMLTAIVVSLGTTGVALALLMRMTEEYGSVEEDDLLSGKARKKKEESADEADEAEAEKEAEKEETADVTGKDPDET